MLAESDREIARQLRSRDRTADLRGKPSKASRTFGCGAIGSTFSQTVTAIRPVSGIGNISLRSVVIPAPAFENRSDWLPPCGLFKSSVV